MQFKSFHWHHWHHGNYAMLYKYGKRTRNFLGRFYFYFILVFYIFGAFLIKQLFHSRLLDMIRLYSQLRVTRLVGCLSTHIERALVE